MNCLSAGISNHHLLQRRHQYLLLLGSDADGCIRHSMVDAVHHGNHGHRVPQRSLQHIRRHGLFECIFADTLYKPIPLDCLVAVYISPAAENPSLYKIIPDYFLDVK